MSRRTPEERGFLAALRNDPADDTTREVYADWLEERGFVERAQYLRGEIERRRVVSPLDRALIEAVQARESNLLHSVHRLLADGANVNARGSYRMTPLHLVVGRREHPQVIEIAKLLLDAGANVHALSTASVSPLECAIEHNDNVAEDRIARSLELIELLLSYGAELPPRTPLARFSCASLAIFERVLNLGASPDLRDDGGNMAIHSTVWTERPRLVECLLSRGVDANVPDGVGRTPLAMALAIKTKRNDIADARRQQLIELLERHGAVATVPLARDSDDPFAPVAVDMEAVRTAVAEVDLDASVRSCLARPAVSAQQLVEQVRDYGEPLDRIRFFSVLSSLLPRHDVVLRGDVTLKRPFFVNGNLTVRGNLRCRDALVVSGDLVVDGVVTDSDNDSLVTVVGDLESCAVYTSGDFAVSGVLRASDVVLGYYNDHVLSADRIVATVVIEDEHATAAEVDAGIHFDMSRYRQGHGEGVSDVLQALLHESLFDEDGQLDNHAVFARLRCSLPIYRWPDEPPAHRVLSLLMWFAARIEAPLIAARFIPGILEREQDVGDEELWEVIDDALKRATPLSSLIPDQPHTEDELRAYLEEIRAAAVERAPNLRT